MAWWLGAVATLTEDMSSVPNTYIGQLTVPCDSSSTGSDVLSWPSQVDIHMHTHIHIIKKIIKVHSKVASAIDTCL